MSVFARLSLAIAIALSACAPAPAVPSVPPPAEPEPAPAPVAPVVIEVEEPEPEQLSIPTDCAGADDDPCVPPESFVRRICKRSTPDLALTMFRKDTRWTRAYLVRDMEAWYVAPDAKRSSPKQMRFAEEVIIVANRSQTTSGFSMTGSGSYDVYRWDGTCVSVMADEVSMRPPDTPKVATIPWKRLDDSIKETLVQNRRIELRNSKRLELCKGFGELQVRRCKRAEAGLSRMIAEYLRGGGDVPPPKSVP